MQPRSRLTLLLVLCLAGPLAASAQQEPVRYTLSFPRPANHYIEVEATYPAAGQRQLDLVMPVWTPGSYLVREYSRNVENVSASAADGRALEVVKTSKNHWRSERSTLTSE